MTTLLNIHDIQPVMTYSCGLKNQLGARPDMRGAARI
jgi:hypothetical protein